MRFTKPTKTFAEQVELLVSRGMEIDDPERAERYLSHLNYYRLAAYWLPCEQGHPTHRFRPGTRFNSVLEHYIFDRELRLLVMDAIERLEVSLRTRWSYYLTGSTLIAGRSAWDLCWPGTPMCAKSIWAFLPIGGTGQSGKGSYEEERLG